jgi:SAM-dependent methyltransferase
MASEFICMQCGSDSSVPFLLNCRDYYLGKSYLANYHKCTTCDLVQQSPLPSDVRPFYESYPVHQRKSSLFELFRRRIMGACYFNVRKYLSAKKSPILLVDFGCGDGWFLDSIRDDRLTLAGYELDQDLANQLAVDLKIPVYSDESELLRDCEGKADVVTMHFVLEHLIDIHHAFQSIQKLLKPGGIFYFTVPNISSWESRLFGRKWHNLDSPRHICFPEGRSVDHLSRKWGFEIAESHPVPFPNGIAGSIPVVLFGRFRFFVFLLSLPLGILLSRIFPSGNTAYLLRRLPEG